jgi:hypothetical protein
MRRSIDSGAAAGKNGRDDQARALAATRAD